MKPEIQNILDNGEYIIEVSAHQLMWDSDNRNTSREVDRDKITSKTLADIHEKMAEYWIKWYEEPAKDGSSGTEVSFGEVTFEVEVDTSGYSIQNTKVFRDYFVSEINKKRIADEKEAERRARIAKATRQIEIEQLHTLAERYPAEIMGL